MMSLANHINDLQAAVVAVQTELGTDPAGDYADVKTRLNSLIPSGSTLPTSPIAGNMFLHTPTGRKVLMQYDGSNWRPIISYGSMTLYVDDASGSDAQDKGGGSGADAFATVQYAVDQIPGSVGGNVVINIASGTFAENVVINGKKFTGDYTITLVGILTNQETVSSATVAAGSGATQGTVTKAGSFAGDSYANLLAYFVTDAGYRLIDSHTDDVLTLIGTAPSSTLQDVNVYDWGVSITKITIGTGQIGVKLTDLKFTTAYGVTVRSFAAVVCTRCSVKNVSVNGGSFEFNYGYLDGSGWARAFDTANHSKLVIISSKVDVNYTSGFALLSDCSILAFYGGTVFDGHGVASYGLLVRQNGVVNCEASSGTGYNRIRNCTIGIYAYTGGMVVSASVNQYSGNTTDESAAGASFGYIG